MDKNSLILVVSLSGNGNGYIDYLKKCKLNEVSIISITMDFPNRLSNLANFPLYYKEDIMNLNDKHWSTITLNFLCDYLLESIIAKKVSKG